MVSVTPSFELTPAEIESLKFIAREENKNINEMIRSIIHENIPSLLDVMDGSARRDELVRALIQEQNR